MVGVSFVVMVRSIFMILDLSEIRNSQNLSVVYPLETFK
jgi:hypothetical protein